MSGLTWADVHNMRSYALWIVCALQLVLFCNKNFDTLMFVLVLVGVSCSSFFLAHSVRPDQARHTSYIRSKVCSNSSQYNTMLMHQLF